MLAGTYTNHPIGVSQPYADFQTVLQRFGFERIQGSLYVTESEDMANLFQAMLTLKAQPWFAPSVRDIHAFRVEQWSDFTGLIKDAL